jgi:hypothetical protein
VKSFGITPKQTNFRSPWQNGVAERWVGNCRRVLLDHVINRVEKKQRRSAFVDSSRDPQRRFDCHPQPPKTSVPSRKPSAKLSPHSIIAPVFRPFEILAGHKPSMVFPNLGKPANTARRHPPEPNPDLIV